MTVRGAASKFVDHRLAVTTWVVAWLALGCGAPENTAQADRSVLPFDSATVRLVTNRDTVRLSLELAQTPEQHTLGLMERRRLADSGGMLFVYSSDQPESAAFWMYRTRIPLDIAFLDSAGVVAALLTMEPCPTRLPEGCPTYPPRVRYRFAVEVNGGYFARHRIGVGSRFLLRDTLTRGVAVPSR